MRKTAIWLACTALVAAAVCVPRPAHALGPVDLEVGARVGGGTNPFGAPNPNPLGFGLGARAGVSILGLYGGLSFMYYLGESTSTESEHALLYGIEGGYGTSLLGLATLRWSLGLGNLQLTQSGSMGSGNSGSLYLEPGANLLIPLGLFFVGADANVLVLPDRADPINSDSSWRFAFTAHGQAGLKF